MASNMLSSFLPTAPGEPSIYETLRQQDDSSNRSDIENTASVAIDEDNFGYRFRDEDLDVEAEADPEIAMESTPLRGKTDPPTSQSIAYSQTKRALKGKAVEDVDNEVPQSLLFEDDQQGKPTHRGQDDLALPAPVPGPPSRTARARWQATQREQQLHPDPVLPLEQNVNTFRHARPLGSIDPKERAVWMWANVQNLDRFLNDVYDYYVGHGIWSILLNRMVKLLSVTCHVPTLALMLMFTGRLLLSSLSRPF